MDLQDLIDEVERQSPTDEPLDRLETATMRHGELTEEADQLLDHFVQGARQSGCSWSQIGEVLGVSKQAAQQQHSADRGLLRWLRRRGGQRGLWRRFTDRARNSVVEAQQAARELGHDWIGTEHVLVGMLTDPDTLAAKVLARWQVDREVVVAEIEQRLGRRDQKVTGHIRFTPRAKKALELALRQALHLKHNYIGTEHFLLGVLQVEDGVGAQILHDHDVTLGKARDAVVEMLATTEIETEQRP